MNILFTVDVEIWCGGWQDLDQRFPDAFRRCIYGPTAAGDYGLPYKLHLLKEHGLTGVFFVEPLFSSRFGIEPLAEIVNLLNESGQEIQLHLHTEWVHLSKEPLIENVTGKRQHLRYFSLEEQKQLIAHGLRLVELAGGGDESAFRAGNFAFNVDTLKALSANDIYFDSSYNACMFGLDSGVMPGAVVRNPIEYENVYEYPMTVFNDGTKSLRHVQLRACSYTEIEGLLWQALMAGQDTFVILSHSFELLNRALNRRDDIVVNRFHKMCSFLDKYREYFTTCGFKGLTPQIIQPQSIPLNSPIWKTGIRMLEQAYRRRYK